MQFRTIASFAVAIVLGLLAVVMVRMYLQGATRGGGASSGNVAGASPVVVAAGPIARGALIAPNLLKVVNYPAASVPAGAFTAVSQVAGAGPNARVSLRAMVADEPVLTTRVSAPGGKPNLSGVLQPGMRAISVKSSDVSGVGGFILPGDRIDVMVTRSVGNNSNDSVTQILAQNVRVLGVDQSDDQDASKPVVAKAVTVEVSTDEAQAISLAQSVGSITLALRQVGDEAPLARKSMTAADLGGAVRPVVTAAARPAAKAPAKAKPKTVEAPPVAAADSTSISVVRGVETAQYTVGR